ncbi:NAD kinase 2, mitochondrial [Diorhabda carinulata]|uniref:NAD kinase 2, mitochondrial n=1 Tax=Diorhabda carinulata TaxID=1163345 RepID=UPI0025A0D096|nr:NAD kinase 2, mitochondrial [Diorhabda carinulata]
MYNPRTLTRSVISGIFKNINMRTKHISNETKPMKMEKALIVSKLSRYEYEKTKHKNLSDKELETLLRKRGSNYEKLISFHYLHKEFEEHLKNTLLALGTEVEVVNRFSCTDEKVEKADIIIPIGGDGTFLLAASRVLNNKKPVIGFNSDPTRSEGYLCLPRWCSLNVCKTIEKLKQGDFQWLMRTRIRITLAVDEKDRLMPQSLHHVDGHFLPPLKGKCAPNVLPVLALNEVFMGETLSARVSHLQMRLNNTEQVTNVKCSGICVSTGTGSTSWHLSINRVSNQSIAEILRLLSINPDEDRDNLARTLANVYNKNLIFKPDDKRMGYTIRDLISSGVWPHPKGIKPRGFVSTIEIKSHCFDAYLVLDGGISFPFNDGAVAVLETLPEDALRTVIFPK